MKVIKSKLVIFLCMPLIFIWVVGSFPMKKNLYGVCEHVLDGDTISFRSTSGEVYRIRLADIDAPELSQYSLAGKFDGLPIGQLSRDYLQYLIGNKAIRVEFKQKGVYGRIIGTLFFKQNLEAIDINQKMVRAGMAVSYSKNGTTSGRYSDLEFEAKLLRKGIFTGVGFLRPKYYRRKKTAYK